MDKKTESTHTHAVLVPKKDRQFQHLLELASKSEIPKSLQNLRLIGLNALIAGLNAVLPKNLLQSYVKMEKETLCIGTDQILLKELPCVVIVGGGKATAQMAQYLIEILGDQIPFKGVINVPHGQQVPSSLYSPSKKSFVEINFSAHPIPDLAGMNGVKKMFKFIDESPKNAILIALISGGGSALMPCPADGITLEDKQMVNRLLIQCGANIQEINTIRKHLSKFKGGHLSQYAFPRRVFSLILSDVIGNELQSIASGPTVPDLTTFETCIEICKRYQIFEKLPLNVRHRFELGNQGKIPETPKPNPQIFDYTTNRIIGSAESSAEAADLELHSYNIEVNSLGNALQGEARDFGIHLIDKLGKIQEGHFPMAFIGTGEFTVTIRGKGKGGRNQEMLLGLLQYLQQHPEHPFHQLEYVIISGAFDGIEGNSPAMGAIVDNSSLERTKKRNLDISNYLNNNDSFNFFQELGDVLITGQTGTNVNDMTLVIVNKIKNLQE